MEYTQVGRFRFHTTCLKGIMATKKEEWRMVCNTCIHKKEILEKIGTTFAVSTAKEEVVASG